MCERVQLDGKCKVCMANMPIPWPFRRFLRLEPIKSWLVDTTNYHEVPVFECMDSTNTNCPGYVEAPPGAHDHLDGDQM